MATNALTKPMTPSAALAEIVGAAPISRPQVVSKMWEYIKAKGLQNPENKREIIADEKLKPIFGGNDRVTMFKMNSHLSSHLTAV